MKDYENNYEYLKDLCAIRGMRPTAVCQAVGLSRSSVTKWRNGGDITMSQARKLAPYLDVTIDELADASSKTIEWIYAVPDRDNRIIARVLFKDFECYASSYVSQVRNFVDYLLFREGQSVPDRKGSESS